MQLKSTLVLMLLAMCSCGTPATNDAGMPVVVDAGTDGGVVLVDAGFDAGLDAGDVDAGVPADAGTPDAGFDAGFDAGVDAGIDAGVDAGIDAGLDAGRGFDASLPDGGVRVRIIAANLTSGNLQNYDLGEGQRILQALQGDIVGIQEFNIGDSSDASISAWVDATFDAGFFWTRGTGRIPNGVISRYPILDAGEWDDTEATDREFTWAVIDVPGPTDVWVVSLHLLSGAGPAARTRQATALVQLLNTNVSAGTHVALVGDLNTDSRVENCLGALDASVVVKGPWPSDYSLPDGGNHNTSTNRGKPYDWVAVSPSLHRQMIPVVLGSQFFPAGLVFDQTRPRSSEAPCSLGPKQCRIAVCDDDGRAMLFAGDSTFSIEQVSTGTIAGISEVPKRARRSLATFLLPSRTRRRFVASPRTRKPPYPVRLCARIQP